MFGSSVPPGKEDRQGLQPGSSTADGQKKMMSNESSTGGEKRSSGNSSPMGRKATDNSHSGEKKRRSSGVSRARDMLSSAKQSLHLHGSGSSSSLDKASPSPIQKLGKSDPALSVAHGPQNNSAGESLPGPRSTFRVGVTEDRNKKCRRTMEDTHAYLYNFLSTPAPALGSDSASKSKSSVTDSASSLSDSASQHGLETDNGYFAIFDGHAGTFAAEWCGKKLHLILEDTIRRNPNSPIPELLDQTFTLVDQQLEKLPLKNSGCTAVIAVLRWEDRVPSTQSATGSTLAAPAIVAAAKAAAESPKLPASGPEPPLSQTGSDASAGAPSGQVAYHDQMPSEAKVREMATRQRVLYTANVGDARIILCRNGRALRLSYDHKGSDENEGKRVSNAGGLILNNRVNGVLAVTRALGDSYMKDLVTGHPYTTETVIQADQDEFLILACDGLWDVCTDQEAVDLIRHTQDPQVASKQLVDHALARFSTDNLSCMVVRFDSSALKERRRESIGVDSEHPPPGVLSEADAIVANAKKQLADNGELADRVASGMIVEEEEPEPGPELNADALKAAQRSAPVSS